MIVRHVLFTIYLNIFYCSMFNLSVSNCSCTCTCTLPVPVPNCSCTCTCTLPVPVPNCSCTCTCSFHLFFFLSFFFFFFLSLSFFFFFCFCFCFCTCTCTGARTCAWESVHPPLAVQQFFLGGDIICVLACTVNPNILAPRNNSYTCNNNQRKTPLKLNAIFFIALHAMYSLKEIAKHSRWHC